tara:strand:- start:1251 stop:2177 length:927 start_codon:yes stop_codon:yes gene_type:complete
MGTFAAIDFETATNTRDSACAVGWVIVEDWKVVDGGRKLIQPPDNDYLAFNIFIHGITPEMTANEPTFDGVWPEVEESIKGYLLVAHNSAFDMSVLRRSADTTNYEIGDFKFACTYRLARDTWKDKWSYRLDDLADDFDIELDHHDPVSDALASVQIGAEICNANEVSTIEEASEALGYRLGVYEQGNYSGFSNAKDPSEWANIYKGMGDLEAEGDVDPDGQLFGKRVCFTGTLESMTRMEASQLAVNCGAKATNSISKNVHYLVVGMTDFSRVIDGMSSKMKKAIALAEAGHEIEIIHEGDFLRMIN